MSFERPDMESAPEFRSYDAALDELTALSKDKRVVFVIDEYPYLAKAKPAISSPSISTRGIVILIFSVRYLLFVSVLNRYTRFFFSQWPVRYQR